MGAESKVETRPPRDSLGEIPPAYQPGRTAPTVECSPWRDESGGPAADRSRRSCPVRSGFRNLHVGAEWAHGALASFGAQPNLLPGARGLRPLLCSQLVGLAGFMHSVSHDWN